MRVARSLEAKLLRVEKRRAERERRAFKVLLWVVMMKKSAEDANVTILSPNLIPDEEAIIIREEAPTSAQRHRVVAGFLLLCFATIIGAVALNKVVEIESRQEIVLTEFRKYSKIESDEDDGVMSLSECYAYDDDSIYPSEYHCTNKDDVAWCESEKDTGKGTNFYDVCGAGSSARRESTGEEHRCARLRRFIFSFEYQYHLYFACSSTFAAATESILRFTSMRRRLDVCDAMRVGGSVEAG